MEVFQSPDFRAYWLEGSSESLLVTFSHVGHGDADGAFFGRSLATATGMSVLGIVDRADRWFPEAAFADLISAVADRVRSFRQVILFGSSMGAYGALRYSRALRATSVVAWAPQWSIAPGDVGDADHRYRRYFDAKLHAGMAILPDHIGGECFVFFDPKEPPDRFHAGRLATIAPREVRLVPMPMLGHEVGHAFASTPTMLGLFTVCAAGNAAAVRAYARTVRRQAPRRALGVSLALADRRPACAEALFRGVKDRVPPALHMAWFERAAQAACRRAAREDAVRFLAEAAPLKAAFPTRFATMEKTVSALG
jgi:pimeloyl-ACP methyl ester carboxylesterase